jgi:hypothetical protein
MFGRKAQEINSKAYAADLKTRVSVKKGKKNKGLEAKIVLILKDYLPFNRIFTRSEIKKLFMEMKEKLNSYAQKGNSGFLSKKSLSKRMDFPPSLGIDVSSLTYARGGRLERTTLKTQVEALTWFLFPRDKNGKNPHSGDK